MALQNPMSHNQNHTVNSQYIKEICRPASTEEREEFRWGFVPAPRRGNLVYENSLRLG